MERAFFARQFFLYAAEIRLITYSSEVSVKSISVLFID